MQMKLMMAAVGLLAFALFVSWIYSETKVRRLERVVESAERQARADEEAASAAESAAGEYGKKIEYLEAEIDAISGIARRQNEDLGKINGDVGAAKRDVERARSIRAIDTTADELCSKLAELGHPC